MKKAFKLDSWSLGSSFDKCAEEAQKISLTKGLVEFEFNGRTCFVDKDTNLTNLWKHFSDAWTMDWKTIGPVCADQYTPEVQAELERRTIANDKRRKEEQAIYEAKEKKEREEFNERVAGVEMEFSDKAGWDDWRSHNTDPYGACVFDYAEAWAKLMQVEMNKFKVSVAQCAEKTSRELGFFGITGFMYGAAVQSLAKCWKYGEDLRKWHNKEYNHEGEGVVNPAILTIG